MDLFSLIVKFVFLLSIFHLKEDSRLKEKTTYYPTYAHHVIDVLKEQVLRERGLWCCGRGGSMPTDVRSLSVDFQSDVEASISQSRESLIFVAEKFLKIINEHKDIRPFLREYPFPVNRVTLSIDFKESSNEKIENRVEHVLLVKGRVYYSIRDKETFKHIELFDEPYEEALRIVKAKKGE